jgi:hypothetical protein
MAAYHHTKFQDIALVELFAHQSLLRQIIRWSVFSPLVSLGVWFHFVGIGYFPSPTLNNQCFQRLFQIQSQLRRTRIDHDFGTNRAR